MTAMLTRRHLLTTGLRTALLIMLLPFLPPMVKLAKAEEQPDGSVLFDGTEYLKTKPFDLPGGPQTIYMLRKEPGNTWAVLDMKGLRVYPEVHDRARREQEVREMIAEAKQERG